MFSGDLETVSSLQRLTPSQPVFTCSKLTMKIPELRHWHRSGVFNVNFEHTSHHVLVFVLLTLKM